MRPASRSRFGKAGNAAGGLFQHPAGKVRGGGQWRCASVPRWSEPEGSLLGQDILLTINHLPIDGQSIGHRELRWTALSAPNLITPLVTGLCSTGFEHHHAARICSDGYRLLFLIIGRIDDRQ